ncbi:coadhesin [Exaiptasia diaphana]|uniref:Uncharacterized protein n=1 Tax=Exaiptasia diaphana TaxID=2652724 RepID=A0A913Y704_EXADI|nr:coadhesin [Exaiptasia diaphana]
MRRFSFLQSITVLLLFGACVYVSNLVAQYVLKENGGYSQWSVFTDCSKTCGGGIRSRRRKCNNPLPSFGGSNCSRLGPPSQVFACNRQPCPINGAYGPWGEYEACTVTCGGGVQVRRRLCDKPPPQYGGKNCKEMELGDDQETKSCNEEKCPVNGGYSVWSEFTDCSKSCGGGVKSRARTCTNPSPDDKGKDCAELGPSNETESCNNEPCPTTMPTTELPKTDDTTLSPETTLGKQTEKPTTEQNPDTPATSQPLDTETKLNTTSEQSPTTISTPETTKEATETKSN